jgi:ketosteroid isomerase-like protein
MRSLCCGISAGAIAPAGGLTRQFWGSTRVRDGKLARAQMFYFDPLAAAEFLATSGRQMA